MSVQCSLRHLAHCTLFALPDRLTNWCSSAHLCSALFQLASLAVTQVVAQAGLPAAVTIATNMAGRGTDIILGGNPEGLTRMGLLRLVYR
jgi:hypothetical protein